MSSAWGSGYCFIRCTLPHQPLCPLIPPGRGIWWPRVLLTWIPFTWAHVLLSAVFNRLKFSRILCNRPSWFFKCHLLMPLTPLCPSMAPLMPHPTLTPRTGIWWSRVVLLQISMTFGQPVGQADVWSDVPLTPITPYAPFMPPQVGHLVPRMVWTCIPLPWAHVLLSAMFIRPSWVFKSTAPPPVQASSAQEWYYCRPAWYFIRLWVRLTFCQIYSPPHPGQACSGQEQYYRSSDWHLVNLWVRLTCLCEGKSGASSCSNSCSMSRY